MRLLLAVLVLLALAPAARADYAWAPGTPMGIPATRALDWEVAVGPDGEVTAVALESSSLSLVRQTAAGVVVGPVPVDEGAYGVALVADRLGVVHLAYLRGNQIVHAAKAPGAPVFGPAEVVAETPNGGSAPALAVDREGRVAVSWTRFVPSGAQGTRAWEVAVAEPGEGFPQPVVALAPPTAGGSDAQDIAFAGSGELVGLRASTPDSGDATADVAELRPGAASVATRLETAAARLCHPRVAAAPGGQAVAAWTSGSAAYGCGGGSVRAALRPAGGVFGAPAAMPGGDMASDLELAADVTGRAVVTLSTYDGNYHSSGIFTAAGAGSWATGASAYRAMLRHLVTDDAGVHGVLQGNLAGEGPRTARIDGNGQLEAIQDVDPACDVGLEALAATPEGRLAAVLWHRDEGYRIALQESGTAAEARCAPAPQQTPTETHETPPRVVTPEPLLKARRLSKRRVRVEIDGQALAAQVWLKVRDRPALTRVVKSPPLTVTFKLRRRAWRTLRKHGASVAATVHENPYAMGQLWKLKRRIR